MRFKTLVVALTCIFIFLSIGLNAEENKQNIKNNANETVLRAQLELMQRYDEKLLLTVYWALGGVVAITVLLVGFGWFANFRIYDKDKRLLEHVLQAAQQEALNKIRQDFLDEFKELKNQLNLIVSSGIKPLKDELNDKFQDLRQNILNLEYKLRETEAEQWMKQGVAVNAVRAYCDLIDLALSMQTEWRVSEALDKMHFALKNISEGKANVEPDAEEIRQITETLNRVSKEHSVNVTGIRKLLETIRSK